MLKIYLEKNIEYWNEFWYIKNLLLCLYRLSVFMFLSLSSKIIFGDDLNDGHLPDKSEIFPPKKGLFLTLYSIQRDRYHECLSPTDKNIYIYPVRKAANVIMADYAIRNWLI